MDERPDTVAAVDTEALQRRALDDVAAAASLGDLDEARVKYLGRKSELKLALRDVRDRESGMALNAAREAIEHAVEAKQDELERAELDAKLSSEQVDVTLPAELLGPLRPRRRGSLHPTTQVRRDVEDIFLGLGYEVVDDREIETTRYNFDALGFPDWHPARSPRASLYLTDDTLLRTETSPAQIHKMERQRPPIYMLSIGRVYRRDTIDATHFPIFHQFEGLAIDKGITMADLKGTLLYVMRQLYGPEREVRFRTHYFPFTEPSMEVDIGWNRKTGELGRGSNWLEILGSGMVHPKVLANCGIDPRAWQGFAFGMGVERVTMLKHGIPDLRPFYESDIRWLRHYGFNPLAPVTLHEGL